jgi:hypothetical protein
MDASSLPNLAFLNIRKALDQAGLTEEAPSSTE